MIFSSRFSYFKDIPLALVLLLVLQRFGRRQWGHIPELTEENHTVLLHPVDTSGTLSEEEVNVNFYPEDKINSSRSLLGRATTVVGASRKGEDGPVGDVPRNSSKGIQRAKGEAGKDSRGVEDGDSAGGTYQTKPSPSVLMRGPTAAEVLRVYNQARNAYRAAYGKIIKERNMVLKISWPETSRPADWEIIWHAQTLGKNDKFIEGHIPVVKYARDLDRYSTQHIRNFLRLWKEKGLGTRTLRLVVMNRLRPIYDLDSKEFWDVFWQCFACEHC